MNRKFIQVSIVVMFLVTACDQGPESVAPWASVAPVRSENGISTSPSLPLPSTTPREQHPAPTGTPLLPTLLPAPTLTMIPPLNPIRSTPPTLLLHRPNLQFDSLAFLKEFILILKQNNMRLVTYRYIQENPEITAMEQGRLFIITIDDIYLAYPITQPVIEMIEALQEAGYPAVLGVVTETEYPDPGTVARLKELSESGWEIATHSNNHANLGKLESASEKLVTGEVLPSLDKIEKAIGVRPITLILPDGQMVNNIGILQPMDIQWVVGINGGLTYVSDDRIHYVGREGPGKNAEYTYKIMKKRFGF